MKTDKTCTEQLIFAPKKKKSFLSKVAYSKYLLILIAPAFLFYVVFNIVPLYGIILAFKDFMPNKGILGSPWVGFQNFEFIFNFPEIWDVVVNTLIISFGKILFGFPMPIILALLLNELRYTRYKKVVQTFLTFPHFLSWVIIAGFVRTLFSGTGIINN